MKQDGAGSAAQVIPMKQIAGSLKLELAQFREVEAFASFGSELDETTQYTLNRGLRLIELLKQKQYNPMSIKYQVIVVYTGMSGYLDKLNLKEISLFKDYLVSYIQNNTHVLTSVNTNVKLNSTELDKTLTSLLSTFIS